MKCIMGDVQGAYSTIKTILLCLKMIKIVMMPYRNATFSSQRCSEFKLINWRDDISSNNSRDDYFFFASKGNDYSVKGGDYLKYCSLKVVP